MVLVWWTSPYHGFNWEVFHVQIETNLYGGLQMSLSILNHTEREIIRRTVVAAVYGSFFDEGEFHTLFGVTREQATQVLEMWPTVNDQAEVVFLTINNAFANLRHYPHGKQHLIEEMTEVSSKILNELFFRWRSDFPNLVSEEFIRDQSAIE